jgi:hypothetical protein
MVWKLALTNILRVACSTFIHLYQMTQALRLNGIQSRQRLDRRPNGELTIEAFSDS